MSENKGLVSKFFNIFSGEERSDSTAIIDKEQQPVSDINPSDYAEMAELDYIEENDMTAIVSTRKINYGCTLIITRTHEGKDENRIFVKRGTPCAKFIEAIDAHQYTLETADYGTTAVYRRDVMRVPTTPMQLITMSYMQRWGIEEEEISEIRRQMGYNNINPDDIGYSSGGGFSDSTISTAIKEKLGTVITGSKKKKEKYEEPDVESGGHSSTSSSQKRKDASSVVQDIASQTSEALFTPAHSSFSAPAQSSNKNEKKSKGEIEIEEEEEKEKDPEQQAIEEMERNEQLMREKYQYSIGVNPHEIPGTFTQGAIGVDDLACDEYVRSQDPDIYEAPFDEIIRHYTHRVAWENAIEITYDEYMLYEQFLSMGLAETMIIQCMRAWLDDSRKYNKFYGGGYMLTDPEYVANLHLPHTPEHKKNIYYSNAAKYPCRNPDPVQDLAEYLDAVFMKQTSPMENRWVRILNDRVVVVSPDIRDSPKNGFNQYKGMMERMENNGRERKKSDDKEDKSEEVRMFSKKMASSMSYGIFETYLEKIVLEAEHRTPTSMAIIAQMMTVCNGVVDLYEHIYTQKRPPGTMAEKAPIIIQDSTPKEKEQEKQEEEEDDDQYGYMYRGIETEDDTIVNISLTRMKHLYNQVEILNKMINNNVDIFGDHLNMRYPNYDYKDEPERDIP